MKTSKINSGSSMPYALVTGGSKEIGYGIAEALAKLISMFLRVLPRRTVTAIFAGVKKK